MACEVAKTFPINEKIKQILTELNFQLTTLDYSGCLGRELVLRGLFDEALFSRLLDENLYRNDAIVQHDFHQDRQAISEWLKSFELLKVLSVPCKWRGFIEAYSRSGHKTLAERMESKLDPLMVQPDHFKRCVHRALDKYKSFMAGLDLNGPLGYEMRVRGLATEPSSDKIVKTSELIDRALREPTPEKWRHFLGALTRSGNQTLADVLADEFKK